MKEIILAINLSVRDHPHAAERGAFVAHKEKTMKRLALLALVLLIVGGIDASAACFNCKPITQTCASGFRFTFCDDSQGFCDVSGTCTAAAPTATVALASQWTVASVERLDEPHRSAAP